MKTTTSKDGTTLAYDIYGSGPVLIYITGAGCFRSMKPVTQDAELFASEFTVFNYDRRGRGDSDDTLPYAIEREVEDIEAMIDTAGGSAYLYGHSSGAVLALEAALSLSGKVKKVVMYDPSYVHDETEKAEYNLLEKRIRKLLQDGKNAEAMRTFFKDIGIPKLFIFLMQLSRDWQLMVKLAPTLAYDITITQDLPPLDRASYIDVPVQIIVGEKSPASIHHVADQLAKVIPNAKFEQLAGQDHLVKPKALLPLLINFIKKETRDEIK